MTYLFRFLVFTAALSAAAPALAQSSRSARPYRGLFGGGIGETEQLLTTSATVGAGYDDNILAGDGASVLQTPGRSGTMEQASGSMAYSLNRTHVGFGASGSTSMRYYPSLPNPIIAAYNGTIGGTLKSKRTALSASQSVGYLPFLMFTPFLGVPGATADASLTAAPNLDIAITRQNYLSYGTSVEASRSLSSRADVSASYSRSRSQAGSDLSAWDMQTASARFSRRLGRGLAARLGYGYTRADHPSDLATDSRVEGHTADIGVDYDRALSFSRRTHLTFSTGTSAIKQRERTYYRVVGTARLLREIGRSWSASLSYNRDVSFVQSLTEPVFSDAASLNVAGLLHRRVQWQSSVGTSYGTVGFGAGDNGFTTYFATTGLTIGLSRYMGFGVDYSYYVYSLGDAVVREPGVPTNMRRQSLRGSFSVWAPLVHVARRPDAPR